MMYPSNFLERYIPYGDKNHNWPQILTMFAASLAAFSCGSLFAWTSPSIPILISNSSHVEPISLEQASYFSVIPPLAAIAASPIVAILVDLIGRKNTVMCIVFPHFLAWILTAAAENLYIFYLSRVLVGFGDAILCGALPTYIGEVAVPNVRGSWGNLVAIGLYFGQFWVNVVGAYCGIRTTAIVLSCVPIIHVFLAWILPESPYFLLMKGKTAEARDALKFLRWRKDVDDELMSITKAVNRQISESGTLKDLFFIPTNRKALLLSVIMRGSQQLSGLPAFGIYTQYIFMEAGGNVSATTSAMIYSGTLFLATTGFAFVVDKLGRKPLMTFSCFACGIVLAVEATYFYVSQNTDIDVSNLKWVPLVGMLVYILVCSSGLGLIPTLMLGELFSTSIKGKALSVLNISFAIYILSVSKLFQALTYNFGMYVPFYFFSVCCFLATIFSYYYVPETKGKTLEEIQHDLKGKSHSKEAGII